MPLKQTKKATPRTASIQQSMPYSQHLAYVSQPYSSPVPYPANGVSSASPVSYTVPVPVASSRVETPEVSRRNWEAWSQTENQLFFESLVRNSR